MNRKDKLNELALTLKNWPEFKKIAFSVNDEWSFVDNKFVHSIHDPITIDDWNRAKIKPNTKVRILSPEHSEYVQKLAFEAGFKWKVSEESVSHTDKEHFYFEEEKLITYGTMHSVFLGNVEKEITIEMPNPVPDQVKRISESSDVQFNKKATQQEFESRVLSEKVNASDVLSQGAKHLSDRAATYDNPEGERSMGATVEAFESITGHSLTEEQGWLFMALLKAVRSQQGNYKLDNYEDGAAYFALMAESASEARK